MSSVGNWAETSEDVVNARMDNRDGQDDVVPPPLDLDMKCMMCVCVFV